MSSASVGTRRAHGYEYTWNKMNKSFRGRITDLTPLVESSLIHMSLVFWLWAGFVPHTFERSAGGSEVKDWAGKMT